MLIIIMLHQMKQIKLFLSSIVKTLDGKQIHVNCKHIIQSMVHIVRSKQLTWHRLVVQLLQDKSQVNLLKEKLRQKPKQNFLVKKLTILKKRLKKFNNGAKNTRMHKTFLTKFSQKTTILETLMDMISLVKSEIKDPVDHATLFLSPKSSNPD